MGRNKQPQHDCERCGTLEHYFQEDKRKKIPQFLKKLQPIKGKGTYYRGESLQRSSYQLHQCPSCDIYYEEGHHFWSDPESTMGLYREEDDWWILNRLSDEMAIQRLKDLKKKR